MVQKMKMEKTTKDINLIILDKVTRIFVENDCRYQLDNFVA